MTGTVESCVKFSRRKKHRANMLSNLYVKLKNFPLGDL